MSGRYAKNRGGKIDLIICDLPYGVLNRQSEGGGWDSIIPLQQMWDQYLRIIKDDGAIILFAQGMFTAQLMLSQHKLWRYNLVWDKNRPTGFLNANRMPLRVHEDILVFYKSLPVYNPQMEKCAPHRRNHGRGTGDHVNTNRCYGSWNELPATYSDEKFPISIIRMNKEHQSDTWHPTQKPVDLIRYLVRTYSNVGDTILDNCIGSGTTAIACIKEHRNFIGFELNKEYCDKACKRVKLEMMAPTFL